MDIFNLTFTGNLTGDSIATPFEDTGKKVYNFTVAVNVTEKNTMFLDVGYWLKIDSDNEDKLLGRLKKGTSVTIFSDYSVMKSSFSEKNKTNYEALSVTAKRLKL